MSVCAFRSVAYGVVSCKACVTASRSGVCCSCCCSCSVAAFVCCCCRGCCPVTSCCCVVPPLCTWCVHVKDFVCCTPLPSLPALLPAPLSAVAVIEAEGCRSVRQCDANRKYRIERLLLFNRPGVRVPRVVSLPRPFPSCEVRTRPAGSPREAVDFFVIVGLCAMPQPGRPS